MSVHREDCFYFLYQGSLRRLLCFAQMLKASINPCTDIAWRTRVQSFLFCLVIRLPQVTRIGQDCIKVRDAAHSLVQRFLAVYRHRIGLRMRALVEPVVALVLNRLSSREDSNSLLVNGCRGDERVSDGQPRAGVHNIRRGPDYFPGALGCLGVMLMCRVYFSSWRYS